jgi:hypothetical protein
MTVKYLEIAKNVHKKTYQKENISKAENNSDIAGDIGWRLKYYILTA